jgi:F-type H+-transporting ATPase subunit b
MEQTLHALAGLLLKGIPTIVIVLLLHFYLKTMLFRPLERVLRERDEATRGAREAAERSHEMAERKAAEYDEAIRRARSDVFHEQEQMRQQWLADQQTHVRDARARMAELVEEARSRVEKEAESAKRLLTDASGALADEIANSVLSGRAS